MSKNKINIKDIELTRAQIAETFNFAPKYVNELVRDHGAPQSYNLYDWIKWFDNYREKQKNLAIARAKAEKPYQEKTRYEAKIKKLAYYERINELIPADSVKVLYLRALKLIIMSMDGLPAQIANQFPKPKESKKILSVAIDKLKNNIASQFENALTEIITEADNATSHDIKELYTPDEDKNE